MTTVMLAGVEIDALTERQTIERIVDGGGGWVVNPNVDVLRQVVADDRVGALAREATLTVADGTPLIWASRLMGSPLPERIAGSTLIYGVCEEAARRGRSVYLLGGAPGVAERAAAQLGQVVPDLHIAGWHCPPFGFERRPADLAEIDSLLFDARPDIVFVALGFPRQERLIVRLRLLLPQAWFVACGMTLSFVAGDVPRAPVWMQRLGLEWLHRLIHEPRRLFMRYVVHDVPFALRLLLSAAGTRIGALRGGP